MKLIPLIAIAVASAGLPFHAADAQRLTNAAQARYGARFSVTTPRSGSRDPQTGPEEAFDGDVHSRCVLRGVLPYTYVIELPFRVPVDRIAFADSDYISERAPKDVEITLDDDPMPIRYTLQIKRPETQRRPAWQEVAVGREARVVRVTVVSDYSPSPGVNWGGLAEIAILTPTALGARFAAPGAAASVPAYVHVPPLATATATRVALPPPAAPGEHPRLVLTRADVAELKKSLPLSERGRAALKSLVGIANGAAAQAPPDFPDPKGPLGQMTDRGDAVAKRHDRLALNAGTLGIAYALTGEARYARAAADILRGYASRYAAYPEHKGVNRSDTGKVMGQRLSEAMWLIPLIEAYDYICDSGALTADDKHRIETDLIRPAIAFIRRKDPEAEAGERDRAEPGWRTNAPRMGSAANWLLYYNSATMMAGAALGDHAMMDLAAADFRYLLANGIGADGMWLEGAIGYQFFALTALVPGMETAAHQGIDIWGFDNARVKRLFDSPLRYAYPDGTAPGINDSSRTRFGDWSTMVYDYAFRRYGDPGYAYLINASPRQLAMSEAVYFPTREYAPLAEPTAISYPSTVFGNLGYAILRDPQVYALIDYGPHGGVHGHFDKLNLILFATPPGGKGDEMGGEPRFHRYEDPLHDEWTKQTVAHNTMTVDETSQIASEGRLLVFEDTPEIKVMRAETTASVPGAILDRTVVVLPDAVLDLYHGRSSFRRTWDRTLRFEGMLAGLPSAASAPPVGTHDGYQHLRDLSLIPTGRLPASRISADKEPWKGVWRHAGGTLGVSLAPAPGQQVLLVGGPDNDNMVLARQEGDRADFAAAYALESWPNPVQSIRMLPTGNADLAAAELTQRDGTTTTVIVAHGDAGPWQALGWRSDARVLCVRRKGTNVRLLLTGGTFAEGKDGSLHGPTPGNYAAAEQGGGSLKVISAWTPADTGK